MRQLRVLINDACIAGRPKSSRASGQAGEYLTVSAPQFEAESPAKAITYFL